MSRKCSGFSLVLLVLGVAAFLTRAYQPMSRPDQWLRRADKFTNAVVRKNWRGTYQSYHPGVTTMVLGGVALRVHHAVKGSRAEVIFRWAVHPQTTEFGRRMAAGVLGLAVAEALTIVLIAVVLGRLGNPAMGVVAAGLLTFSPPVLTENRAFHPDGLGGLLMFLSAVLLLRALPGVRTRLLLLSGFVAGLSLLTKTPSLFLVPFTALSLGVCALGDLGATWRGPAEQRWRRLWERLRQTAVRPGLIWIAAAALPFAFWPAMWVRPLDVLNEMVRGITVGAFNPHEKMVFFSGQTYHGRAPLFFYPLELIFRSTFVTFTLALAAIGQYSLGRKRFRLLLDPAAFWLLWAYVGFFALQMALSVKQTGTRYVYPAQVGVEVIAAVGFAGLAATIRQRVSLCGSVLAHLVVPAMAAVTIAFQALIALPYAPDYGAHHDPLLGGNPVARKLMPISDGNDGIMAVSDYLNGLPQAASLKVATVSRLSKSLRQYFAGTAIEGMSADADYYLFELGSQQRSYVPEQWEAAWKEVQGRRADAVVMIDRVVFLWLFRRQGEAEETVVIRRGWEGMGPIPWFWTLILVGMMSWASRSGARPTMVEKK